MSSNDTLVHRVYFEVTNACNFSCDFCPIRVTTRKPQCMDWGLFRSGVDQVVEDRITDSIGFHVLGEPLLYPPIVDAVGYAHGRGLRTGLTTNGSVFTEDRIHGLLDAGLDALNISWQMIGPRAHECRESGLSYGEYSGRILDSLSQMRRSARRPEVEIMTMGTWSRRFFDVELPMRISDGTVGIVDRLTSLFQDVYLALGKRVPREEIRRSVRRLSRVRPWRVRVDERTSVSMLPFMDWGNAFTSRKVYPAPLGACAYLMNNIGVLSNGEVTICCGDYDGKTSLGNLRDRPLAEMLTSERARALRDGRARMQLVHPHCKRCMGSTSPAKAVVKGLAGACVFALGRLTRETRLTEAGAVAGGRMLPKGATDRKSVRYSPS